jgi:hypothetical protein
MRAASRIIRARIASQKRPETVRSGTDLADECRSHIARACLDRHTDPKPGIRGVGALCNRRAATADLRGPAYFLEEDALAIDGEFQLMRMFETTDGFEIGPEERDLKLVFTVERKIVLSHKATHGAQWQAFPIQRLRLIAPDTVSLRTWKSHRIANGQSAYAICGRKVTLEQSGRDNQKICDVVEAECRVIGWQKRGNINVDVEEVTNRIGILGAVQATERRTSRVGSRARVEFTFEPLRQLLVDSRIGSRRPLRGHRACLQLSDNRFPRSRIPGYQAEIKSVEREVARQNCLVVARKAVLLENFFCLRLLLAAGR